MTPRQTPWLSSGTTFNYTVSVGNNDGGSCGSSNFSLQANVPAGWNAVYSSPLVNVTPGGTAMVVLSVTSPAGTTDGSYAVVPTAVNGSNSGSVSGSFVIVSGLAVSAASTAASYTRTQTAKVTATVRAGGVPVAGAPITFTMTKSNGAAVATTAITDANGNAYFQYAFNRKKDPSGSYTVRAQATSNGYSGSGSTSFIVK
jgi:hypothetical protein